MINSANDPFLTAFPKVFDQIDLTTQLSLTRDELHNLCEIAVKDLQYYLTTQEEFNHNFGLSDYAKGPVIGKMFGVLVVQNKTGDFGYLSAFSGKLAGGNHHPKFVPPVFDSLAADGFLNRGMEKLTAMNLEISMIEANLKNDATKITALKLARRKHSHQLQQELFDHYHFLNGAGEEKSLRQIFKEETTHRNPPVGAGECAAPKLFQYAFKHQLKPLAIAEFWWGLSPKSAQWKHGHFYPSCKEKCEPILTHMLVGIEVAHPLD